MEWFVVLATKRKRRFIICHDNCSAVSSIYTEIVKTKSPSSRITYSNPLSLIV